MSQRFAHRLREQTRLQGINHSRVQDANAAFTAQILPRDCVKGLIKRALS
ncbi:MAG: hypothetical protein PUB37_00190 [Firmicutes bacterium]|nr:hypothetical protein [Bacillota bacterium]